MLLLARISLLLIQATLQPVIFSHCDARGNVVNMLLDMSGNMILIAGNIGMVPRAVLPEVEVGKKKIFGFMDRGVKLNPL